MLPAAAGRAVRGIEEAANHEATKPRQITPARIRLVIGSIMVGRLGDQKASNFQS
jgi:hypothetical protein